MAVWVGSLTGPVSRLFAHPRHVTVLAGVLLMADESTTGKLLAATGRADERKLGCHPNE